MNLSELIKSFSSGSDDSALQKANDKLVLEIVRATLKEIRTQLDETDEGKVVVPLLGTFVVKSIARKKGGEEEAQVQRVILRKPGVKKTGKKGKLAVSGGNAV